MATPTPRRRPEPDAHHLLPFQRHILSQLLPPPDSPQSTGNVMLLLARGLGLRNIITTLLKIYDSQDQLVLVVNANTEEERGFSEEVGMRLKVIGHEMPQKTREDQYKSGGLVSVTSRILVVDMLMDKIPVELVKGIIVLHAETVTPTSLEAFVVRIFREKNKTGFLKAFSDSPESFTFGLSPLQTTLTQLKIREVLIWPRFHETINLDLQKRIADVVEFYQPMSSKMKEIQNAILECMEQTLGEIKRSNTYLEVEDLTIENALFRSFDQLVRVQLDPVWHKVGPKTKQLVGDLTTLRKLQAYLLEFDAVSFNRFIETILIAQDKTPAGQPNKNQSPWLFTTAASTIITLAKERVYLKKKVDKGKEKKATPNEEVEGAPEEEEEQVGWGVSAEEEEALRDLYGEGDFSGSGMNGGDKGKGKEKAKTVEEERDWWLPPNVEPVLEEQPKWALLKDVLEEIETDLYWSNADPYGLSNNTILVMCSSSDTCSTLRQYLASATAFPDPFAFASTSSSSKSTGHSMLRDKLQSYFYWKAHVGQMRRNQSFYNQRGRGGKRKATGTPHIVQEDGTIKLPYESPAMRAKSNWKAGGRGMAPANKRRRVRGGGSISVGSSNGSETGEAKVELLGTTSTVEGVEAEAEEIAELIQATNTTLAPSFAQAAEPTTITDYELFQSANFDEWFGLISNEDLVIIRPYADDEDDKVLEELRPKYIVMYDPTPDFVRRIEAYKAAHQGLAVRVYFLMYEDSVEEQRYLSTIRKEKDAFERLIRERGSMAIPHEAEYRAEEQQEEALRTISSRVAGGRVAKTDPPKVVVDVREFRSSLPSLLHAGRFEVIPTTISVGDYIITPEMCVERKSIPDLIQSFNSGRLYQQCEHMSTHYKQPILLIEFDEKKSFTLESYAEPNRKGTEAPPSETDLRSKIVLLTITFPRLRTIWSSSPSQTVEIFRELKANRDEPDVEKAVQVGADISEGGTLAEGSIAGEAGFSMAPQEMLRTFPGISSANYRYVSSKVDNVEELCGMDEKEVKDLVGVEKGKLLHAFLHQSVTSTEGYGSE